MSISYAWVMGYVTPLVARSATEYKVIASIRCLFVYVFESRFFGWIVYELCCVLIERLRVKKN